MQDFLQSKAEANNKPVQPSPPQDRRVDLCVMLPNRSKCTVSIKENSRTLEVFEVCVCVSVSLSLCVVISRSYNRKWQGRSTSVAVRRSSLLSLREWSMILVSEWLERFS